MHDEIFSSTQSVDVDALAWNPSGERSAESACCFHPSCSLTKSWSEGINSEGLASGQYWMPVFQDNDILDHLSRDKMDSHQTRASW